MLSLVAPHLCCGCSSTGKPLCDNCKYNIISELGSVCLVCRRPCGVSGICTICRVPYDQAWFVGDRRDTLQRLIGLYKFERVRAAYRDLGELLLATVPDLPPETIIVPVPTVSAHVRERGYDHMLLIARYSLLCQEARAAVVAGTRTRHVHQTTSGVGGDARHTGKSSI